MDLSIEQQLQSAGTNTTALWDTQILGWADGPAYRGTSDILWSCTVTILASVYTSIHPNIPLSHQGSWKRFFGKVRWALVALLAPELVLQAAFEQYMTVRLMTKKLNEMATSHDSASIQHDVANVAGSKASSERFDMIYGFWIVMGGCILETADLHKDYSRMALSPEGAILLAKQGHFIKVPRNQIRDRSKANALAKALVCLQVLWMFLQCIVRAIAGYPLTLLEIHTMVHVFCAICIYALWWHKPLDVDEPIVIESSKFKQELAFMITASIPIRPEAIYRCPCNSRTCQLHSMSEAHLLETSKFAALPTPYSWKQDTEAMSTFDPATMPPHVGTMAPEIAIPQTSEPYVEICISLHKIHQETIENDQSSCCLHLGPQDIDRWQLASSFLPIAGPNLIKRYLPSRSLLYTEGNKPGRLLGPRSIADPSSMQSLETVLTGMLGGTRAQGTPSPLTIALILLPMAYGGIHLTAWNFTFPTYIESKLWKISAFAVMFIGLSIYLLYLTAVLLSKTQNKFLRETNQKKARIDVAINAVTFLFALLGFCVFFPFARLYLVVESFISLRSIPLGALSTTPWLQSIPHV